MSKKSAETKAQFARRMGVSRQRVSQWAADGLPLDADGHVRIAPGLRWIKNRIPQIARFQDRGIHLVADKADSCGAAQSEPASSKSGSMPQAGDAGIVYTKARALKMVADSRRAKTEATRAALELSARQGELVLINEMKIAAFNRARIVRDGMLNIPDRIAPLLAAEDDEAKIHEILVAEIRMAMEELSGGASGGAATIG